jgi:DNA-binding response OmpR family regulator
MEVNMKVLLVDDEKELVTTLAERLNMRGLETQWATSAAEALHRLQTESFDIAVLDVKMPKVDGLLLKKQMQERCPTMKFIFVTGHGSSQDFETGASEVGSDYYLVKPLKIEVLIARIKEALQC